MTEGMRTSEALVVVALLCAAVLFAALGKDDLAEMALLSTGIAGGGYALSRGIAKGAK